LKETFQCCNDRLKGSLCFANSDQEEKSGVHKVYDYDDVVWTPDQTTDAFDIVDVTPEVD